MSPDSLGVHQPVLRQEVLDMLQIDPQATDTPPLFFDGTTGAAGHAAALLQQNPEAFLIGADKDEEALKRSRERLAPYAERCLLLQENFASLEKINTRVLADPHAGELLRRKRHDGRLQFDRVLLDLGISSAQLDAPERGFSFSEDGPLDMRLDRDAALTASEVLNSYPHAHLLRVFRSGGVGGVSSKLAQEVIAARPLATTREFAQICSRIVREYNFKRKRRGRAKNAGGKSSHPATVPFQSVRIEVNAELEAIREFMSAAVHFLAPGARLAVICFHSLEDKLVAKAMREWSRPDAVLQQLPQQGSAETFGMLLTKKALVPRAKEIAANPRARSARLRVFERRAN